MSYVVVNVVPTVGMEKTLDGKKFNAQRHGIRLGSQNANEGGTLNILDVLAYIWLAQAGKMVR